MKRRTSGEDMFVDFWMGGEQRSCMLCKVEPCWSIKKVWGRIDLKENYGKSGKSPCTIDHYYRNIYCKKGHGGCTLHRLFNWPAQLGNLSENLMEPFLGIKGCVASAQSLLLTFLIVFPGLLLLISFMHCFHRCLVVVFCRKVLLS